VTVGDRSLTIPAILPKLARTPGYTDWPGAELGAHSNEILQALGYDDQQIADLTAEGHI
jgi:formyl-CoA transferase